ncbi:MAG: VOC family protein, partial [Myxococcota bacterium]
LDFEAFLRRPGYNHLCFRVPDVDRAAGAIRRSGTSFDLEPTDYPDVGRRVAFFRDPFGNYLELAGPLSPTAAVARSQ